MTRDELLLCVRAMGVTDEIAARRMMEIVYRESIGHH